MDIFLQSLQILFLYKYLYNPPSDLLGPDSINDRIKSRWDNHVYISQKNVDIMWNVLTKAVCHKRKKMLAYFKHSMTQTCEPQVLRAFSWAS